MKTLLDFLKDNDLYDLVSYTTFFELSEDPEYLFINIEHVIETSLDENEPEKIFVSPDTIVHHITDYAEYYIWFENNEIFIEEFDDQEVLHFIDSDIDLDLLINKFYRDGLGMTQIMEFLKL